MNIGFAIKSIRTKLSIPQYELAERCQISQTTLSQIETGRKRPSPGTLNKICKVLDIPPAIIYIVAMEGADVPESKKAVYDLVFPSIKGLALQMLDTAHHSLTESKDE